LISSDDAAPDTVDDGADDAAHRGPGVSIIDSSRQQLSTVINNHHR
jgi:hypothetical protein